MKKHLLFLTLSILFCSLFCSCIQDDGSYDDWKSKTVTIVTATISNGYYNGNEEYLYKIIDHKLNNDEIAALHTEIEDNKLVDAKIILTTQYKHKYTKTPELYSATVENWDSKNLKYTEDRSNAVRNEVIEEEPKKYLSCYVFKDEDYVYVIDAVDSKYYKKATSSSDPENKVRLTFNIKGILNLKLYFIRDSGIF